MRIPVASLFVCLMACGSSSQPESAGVGPSPSSGASAPGGGVSFGGAQDIGELRGILDAGGIPGPDTFDANGFFNEHFNAEPPAACGQTLCISPGMSVGRDWLTGAHQATLQLALTTPLDPSTFQRLPMNLVVVVDHSGSMASDGRLDKVKAGLHTMITNLQDEDRLAIVQFDDQIDVLATFGTTLDRASLGTIVDSLTPRGATDIFDGLQRGFQLLGDAPDQTRQNRVIFLSDGNATAGDTFQADIMAMAASYVRLGIGLTTIGVGADFDVDLMRSLAEQGAGNFYFLEDPTAATEVFTEELDFFMQPIALDVAINASAGPGYQFGEVVGSHLWQANTTSGTMSIPAVFLASRTSQAGEQGRRGGGSMVFIHMTPITGNTGLVANLSLSFRPPGQAQPVVQTATLNYADDPNATPDQPYLSTPEMAERYAMYNMFLGIRAATQSSDPSCATAALDATLTAATAWNAERNDPDLTADIALVNEYLTNLGNQPVPDVHADKEPAMPTCPAMTDPYGGSGGGGVVDPGEPIDAGGPSYKGFGCSTGAASGGLPLIAAALGALRIRRRRR